MKSILFAILLTVSPFQIEEIEVTAAGVQVPHQDFAVVAQISHREIENLPITSIADLLAYLPNLDVRSRGASNAQSDISLRGGTFDQVQVQLNGIPIQDTQTGHYTLNIPISSALIERIEVLQNATNNALCGAINIVTRNTEENHYTLQLSAGTNGDAHPSFTSSWKRGDVHINASADYARSSGYYAPTKEEKEVAALENTDYQLANIYLQTRWQGLDVQAGAQYKDAGLGTGYGYASTDQFDATRTMFASAAYSEIIHPQWNLSAHIAYRGQYDRYEWHHGTPTNRHWTHNTQAAFHVTCDWFNSNKTTFGAEFRDEFIRSTNMGEHNRWQATVDAQHSYQWRGLKASLGIAGHYHNWHGWYGTGHAEIGYQTSRAAVAFTATRSMRMPTWTDMFYKAGVQRGSDTLKAEQAWTLAINGDYTWYWQKAGRLTLSGDIYYRLGENIIDWTYNETDSLFHATNQQKVDALGVSLTAHYHLNDWLRGISAQYAYTYLSLDVVTAKSNYLDYLKHKIVIGIDHGIYVWTKGCFGAHWSFRWQQREGTYVDIYGTAGNAFTPVILLDGSLYIELPYVRIALECNNMLNRHYYDYGGILMPGTHGRISITAKL